MKEPSVAPLLIVAPVYPSKDVESQSAHTGQDKSTAAGQSGHHKKDIDNSVCSYQFIQEIREK